MPTDIASSLEGGPHQCTTLVTDSGTGEKLCVVCGKTVVGRGP